MDYKVVIKFQDDNITYSLDQLKELGSGKLFENVQWSNYSQGKMFYTTGCSETIYHDFKVKQIDHEAKRVVLTNLI